MFRKMSLVIFFLRVYLKPEKPIESEILIADVFDAATSEKFEKDSTSVPIFVLLVKHEKQRK